MRIVIDLQGAQSYSSRNRGIGRYTLSLAKAIIANRGEHEIIIALNSIFLEATDAIYAEFSMLLPPENIVIWHVPSPVLYIDKDSTSRREVAESTREAFFASLRPDMVLVMSLFEGYGDDSVTTVASFSHTPTAVILYDLIPLIHKDVYLSNPDLKAWYLGKIKSLKRADLLLSISKSAKNEAHDYLHIPEDDVINISTAADAHFYPREVDDLQREGIEERYAIHKSFIMYTGGMDYRKNIEGLIRAYALLSADLRERYQLAIVCSMGEADRVRLTKLVEELALLEDEVIFTGFVSDEDLVLFYNLCDVFVFPSWHEGFGLPALEAMLCGRVVIGSNTSSLPEVIGLEEALFDPRDDLSISAKLEQALTDEPFRERLKSHGVRQAQKFSWDTSAIASIAAIEDKITEIKKRDITKPLGAKKPSMAYLSPLPPERSGISDYSAELLPALSEHYQIELITDQSSITDSFIEKNCRVRGVEWFREHHSSYDRILYHFGNSHFHKHMFDLLADIPGVVVLHDFYLSGVSAYMEQCGYKPQFWTQSLYRSHGYAVLKDHLDAEILNDTIGDYPTNLPVLQNALGVIVHSENSRRLGEQWYGRSALPWSVIPLLRIPTPEYSQLEAREALGLPKDAFVICSFGLLHQNKLNHRLLQAFLGSRLAEDQQCHLIFVGESRGIEYADDIRDISAKSNAKERIHITDWTPIEVFRRYLQSADIGVQLRTNSRGESSAAVLDCMNYGLATIVNANGAIADLSPEALVILPDEFSDSELIEALESLHSDRSRRVMLGQKAREIILTEHEPIYCAREYAIEIEDFYDDASDKLYGLMQALPEKIEHWSSDELSSLSSDIAQSFPPRPRIKQILVDIAIVERDDLSDEIKRRFLVSLEKILTSPPKGYRVEPIYLSVDGSHYCYARTFTTKQLSIPSGILSDEPIDSYCGDIFVGSDIEEIDSDRLLLHNMMHYRGIAITYILYESRAILDSDDESLERDEYLERLKTIASLDALFTLSRAEAEEIEKLILDEDIETDCRFEIENSYDELSLTLKTISKYVKYFDLPESIKWRVEGPFDSSYSLALINRETSMALSKLGHDLQLHSTEGPGDFLPNEGFLNTHSELKKLYLKSIGESQRDVDISSRNIYPPRVSDMGSPINLLHHYAWEESAFPREWVQDFNRHLTGMTCLSSHVEKIMIDNGVKVPIATSGCGVDHWERTVADESYILEDDHSFRFLHVSSCFPRKGADLLLRAYGEKFDAKDDVVLIIKTFPNPHNEIYRWIEEAKSSSRSFPAVIVIEDDLSPSQLKSLYQQCHAYVGPSRAEGFGVPFAEAILSGLALIVTGWGGQLDFCTDETAWLIDYDFAAADTHFGLPDSVWAEPSREHLGVLMREIHSLPAAERRARSKVGRTLLLDNYRWMFVAERLVEASREFGKSIERKKANIGWITTWNTKCGIAAYSRHLIEAISQDVTILAAHTDEQTAVDDSSVYRCWNAGEEKPFRELEETIDRLKLDTIVLQFNYGFFSFHHLYEFMYQQFEKGHRVVVMMHATTDPTHIRFKDLKILLPLFEYASRLLVHSIGDLNHLKRHGLTKNVTLFPHGIPDWSYESDRERSDRFMLGSYGFFLPHKGLPELIVVVKILSDRGVDIGLKMINAEYPVPISHELVMEASQRIERLGLSREIELVTDYLPDEESLAKLSSCDLLLFPYQETGESSSASVRYGLATGLPVAVTPLDIFEDVDQAVYRLSGCSAEEMADSLEVIIDEIKSNSTVAKKQREDAGKWCQTHRYSAVGKRLGDMLEALR
ncbi:MAG: glycosyltransferase [Campylobacterota bacterium]|nr:glycosyltransferase [Campylobacterota bacterium]